MSNSPFQSHAMRSLILVMVSLCLAATARAEQTIVYQFDFGPKDACVPGHIALQTRL